jgi:predicted metal-dependent hydrolase
MNETTTGAAIGANDVVAAPESAQPQRARGRTEPLDPFEADRLFGYGVALFNGARYWHAHEAWETLWRAAEDKDRDFYQGLIQIAAGLLHLQRRNTRGARNKLSEGVVKLRRYQPAHRGIFVNELIGAADRILGQLGAGYVPHLISPVIRFVESDALD